jgi:hypothetical protein
LTDLSGYAKKSTTNGDTRSGLLLRLRIVVQDPSSWAGEAKTRGTRLRSAIQTSGSGTGSASTSARWCSRLSVSRPITSRSSRGIRAVGSNGDVGDERRSHDFYSATLVAARVKT